MGFLTITKTYWGGIMKVSAEKVAEEKGIITFLRKEVNRDYEKADLMRRVFLTMNSQYKDKIEDIFFTSTINWIRWTEQTIYRIMLILLSKAIFLKITP